MDKKVGVGIVAIIVVIVAITAGVIGMKLGGQQKSETAPAPVAAVQQPAQTAQTQSQPSDSEQISLVVKNFYNTYLAILKQADADYAVTKKTVQFGDKIKQQEANYVTSAFFINTENKTPIACTTDWSSWGNYNMKNYAQPIVTGLTATEKVTLPGGGIATVSVKQDGGIWKVDNILCGK